MKDASDCMQEVAEAVRASIPEDHGFFVMVFPFNPSEAARSAYASDTQRDHVLNVMKEFLIKCGAQEDWMKNIK